MSNKNINPSTSELENFKVERKKALADRRKMTFMPDEDYYSINPPFPREITIDINNRCNHTCYFCANNKIEHYAAIETNLAYDLMKQAYVAGCTDLAFQATGEPFMDKRLTDFVSEGKRIGFDYFT